MIIILRKQTDFDIINDFDCGDDELNEVFQKDALDYKKELLLWVPPLLVMA